jgi:hypothetical protein
MTMPPIEWLSETKNETEDMAAIILGKNLLSDEELIEYAFSDDNVANMNLTALKQKASDAAIASSLLLIRMMKIERIFVETVRHSQNPAHKSSHNS